MAEGQAVACWARQLRQLGGQPIVDVRVPPRWRERAERIPGQVIERVTTHGKHLMLHFSCDLVAHCHALMFGSWQVGRRGMALRKEAHKIRLRLRTTSHEAVYFNGPVMELLTPQELAAHATLNALGPDVMQPSFDPGQAYRRLVADPHRVTGDAVLDQRLVAGIGNIYKSEGLFLARIDPRAPVGQVGPEGLERLWRVLVPLMWRAARGDGSIVTLDRGLGQPGERYWVYRRRGRPCFVCGDPVRRIVQGEMQRATFFCPTCQRGFE